MPQYGPVLIGISETLFEGQVDVGSTLERVELIAESEEDEAFDEDISIDSIEGGVD
jgi:hypothetical protein